jgi:hypothetical protein
MVLGKILLSWPGHNQEYFAKRKHYQNKASGYVLILTQLYYKGEEGFIYNTLD